MYMRVILVMFCALLALLAGCSSGGSHLDLRSASGFQLRVLPETFEAGSSADFSLSQSPDGDNTVIEIKASNAVDLKAAYIAVSYDPAAWVPTNVEATDAIAGSEDRLELSDIRTAGTVYAGQVAIHPQLAAGLSGTATIASPSRRACSLPPAAAASLPFRMRVQRSCSMTRERRSYAGATTARAITTRTAKPTLRTSRRSRRASG